MRKRLPPQTRDDLVKRVREAQNAARFALDQAENTGRKTRLGDGNRFAVFAEINEGTSPDLLTRMLARLEAVLANLPTCSKVNEL